jgi:hypothetical protein
MTTCRIITHRGVSWDVLLDGAAIVTGSRDPESDACRALLALGRIGAVRFIDGRTGRHRSTIRSISAGARLETVETGSGPRVRRRAESRTDAPPIAPTDPAATPIAATACGDAEASPA